MTKEESSGNLCKSPGKSDKTTAKAANEGTKEIKKILKKFLTKAGRCGKM